MKSTTHSAIGALAAWAAALLMLAWSGSTAAAPIGEPFYRIDIDPWDETLTAPPGSGIRLTSPQHAVNGTMAGGLLLGPYVLPLEQADLVGFAKNHGQTFFADASTPVYTTLPRPPGSYIGGFVEVEVAQSFRKSSPDASLSFTYSAAFLELYRDVELAPACAGCTVAEVGWRAEVSLHSDPDQPAWWQLQRATLEDVGGVLNLDFFGQSNALPLNPMWTWDCARCGLPARGMGQAKLQAPYTGIVDLSGIPYDHSLPPEAQPEFTVRYTLWALAYDDGLYSGARAFARDPLGGDTGVSFGLVGLVPTNAPIGVIPEPASWLTMLLGLGVVVGGWQWRVRRHPPRVVEPAPVGRPGRRLD